MIHTYFYYLNKMTLNENRNWNGLRLTPVPACTEPVPQKVFSRECAGIILLNGMTHPMKIHYVLRNRIQYALHYVHIKLELPVLPAPPSLSEEPLFPESLLPSL